MNRISFLILLLSLSFLIACSDPAPTEIVKLETQDSGDFGIRLTDVSKESGLATFKHESAARGESWFPETMGAGGAFVDVNSDGFDDIILVQGSKWEGEPNNVKALKVFQNDQKGGFADVSTESGFGNLEAYGMGITAADYDNDGDQDFFFTTLNQNYLFQNNNGAFTDVSLSAGLGKYDEWSTASLFFDADKDGHLDLFVGNYVEWTPEKDVVCTRFEQEKTYCTPELYAEVSPHFYHNNGDGTFTERTEEVGMGKAPGKTLAIAEFDFNKDGWSDLIVANDLQRDLLFVNNGDGSFTEKGELSGIAFDDNGRARAGMGIDTGIVDDTGESTVFIGHFTKEMIGVYRHKRRGLFLERSAISKIGRPSLLKLTFGVALMDVELDGDLDLFAANGHIIPVIDKVEDSITYRQSSQIFVNTGGGKFETAKEEEVGALGQALVARSIAYADYDHDGDVDILLTENNGPVHLWRNDSESGNSFRVKLEGSKSNRDGLGASIHVHADSLHLIRRVRTGSSYLSTSEKVATFGLGNLASIDSVKVYWPSGIVDVMRNQDAGRAIVVREGS